VTQPSSAIPGFRTRLLLGTGQTSIVYLADDKDGREIALKVPRPEIRNDPILGKVFYNEVVMLKTLDHPNVVRYFTGAPSGVHAHLAVQYFPEGELNPRTLNTEQILAILLDISSALEYCHSKKVIHQDVKPSNIYTSHGRGFLADFGAASSDKNPTPPAGSPFYMSPEVFRGEHGTVKSDVYSFSIMSYELLTKERPIVGHTVEELQIAHMTKIPIPVKTISPLVPRALARLIDRGLAKEVGFRPTMRDFRVVLTELVSGEAPIESETTTQAQESSVQEKPVITEAPKMILGRAPKVEFKPRTPEKPQTPPAPAKQSIMGKLFKRK
jgi:eukaryotic-like serine/threonine-protein kinase